MAGIIPAVRKHLIDSIAAHTRSSRPRPPVPPAEFVKAYYRGVDEDDLRGRAPAALAAVATDQLRFGSTRRAGRPLVRVFNPTEAEHGWVSTHTVVEVVTDDMPFLVDSLAMVLNDCGLALHMMVHPVLHVLRDRAGRLEKCSGDPSAGAQAESWQHIEVDRCVDTARLADVRARILAVLADVQLAVRDWQAMTDKALELSRSVGAGLPGISRAESRRSERVPCLARRPPLHVPRFSRVPARARRVDGQARAGCGLGTWIAQRGQGPTAAAAVDPAR